MEDFSMKEVLAALASAKQSFDPILKDRTNDFFNSKYATLGAVLKAVGAALDDAGLIVVQTTDVVATTGDTALITTLFHVASGESITSTWPLHPVKKDPQGEGSAWTYARRYSLMGMFGLNAEDDDGNAATQRRPSKDWAKELTKAKSSADCRAIWALANEAGDLEDLTIKKMIEDRGAAFKVDEDAKVQAEPTAEGVAGALDAEVTQ